MPGTQQEWDALRLSTIQTMADSPSISNSNIERLIPRFDEVTKPEHYNSGAVECIEAIKASMSLDEFKGYLKGNALKYLWRYRYKGKPAQDLAKAQWYLNKLSEEVK